MRDYQHTQTGYATVALIGSSSLALVAIVLAGDVGQEALALGLAVALVLVLCFAGLTTTVRGGSLRIAFGIGLLHRTVRLSEIQACSVVRNPWYYGIGIHYTPHGWLYNVSGLRAVEVRLIGGKRFRVGTDEPEALCQAIMGARTGRLA